MFYSKSISRYESSLIAPRHVVLLLRVENPRIMYKRNAIHRGRYSKATEGVPNKLRLDKYRI